ncbi:purine-nucleoside phosphorylase [candidate division KSB1 bacterium]|nr:MAG: purine-nucleoside phosphorylase [candidate division KSB1 bacterium]
MTPGHAIDLDQIASLIPGPADVALILGSGLGACADTFRDGRSVKTSDLPGYPVSTVAGHAGRIVVGLVGRTHVMAFQGRVHMYEGYSPDQVVIPVRLAHQIGVRTLIVTNASGAFNKRFHPGDLLLIEDHINLQFRNPLRGPKLSTDERWPDLGYAYDRDLCNLAETVALELKIPLKRGTLAALTGPTYETPAESKMLARLGADAGCMSTVPEVIAANALGMRVLGISCITNYASGIGDSPLDHNDVQLVAAKASEKFAKLLAEILIRIKQNL